MKGIGIFVLLLLVAGGIAMYVYTRPPDRSLDAAGRAWVTNFSAWRGETARRIDRVDVAIGLSTQSLGPRLIRPLATCSDALARLGEPPTLLDVVVKDARTACGEVGYALAVNARYGSPSLATVRQHLHRAGEWFDQAERDLRTRLDGGGS